jgi:gluconolactonase
MSRLLAVPSSQISAADAPFVTHDPRFAAVTGDRPRLEQVMACDAHEGPVYVASEDALYFTSVPRSQGPGWAPEVAIKRLELDGDRFPLERERLSVMRASANAANGMAADHESRLVICEQGDRSQSARISRFDPAADTLEMLVEDFHGLSLSSPNDIVVKSDGTIWFTDPSYGHLQGFRPAPELGEHVYRYEPRSHSLSIVAEDFDKPNGLVFSPDEQLLYVTDSGANQEAGSYYPQRPHHIRAFDVQDGVRLERGRVFAVTTPGYPDGIKVDRAGRVYASSFNGVQIFAPDGDLIGEINLPGTVNFTFGGERSNVLFITADTAVWAAVLNATGPRLPAVEQQKGASRWPI